MIFRVLLAAVLLALPLRAATGDSVSSIIHPNGWWFMHAVSGLLTNGTFANGLGTNSTPLGNEKITFTVGCPGFTSAGISNWQSRTSWFGARIRFPYPSDAFAMQYTNGGGTTTNYLSMSRSVYAGDTVTVNGLSGYYTQGGNPNNAFSGAVNNLSTRTYSPPIANWTWPGGMLVGNTMRLRMVAFHADADDQDGSDQPVACVKFIVTGATSGVKVTNVVTSMSVDTDFNNNAPFWNRYGRGLNMNPGEYIADVDCSGFTPLERLRCDFEVYPHRGTNYFATSWNTFTGLTAMPTSITNLYDPNDAYSQVYAVVASGGSDTAGRPDFGAARDPSTIPSGEYYATIAGANNMCAASNNTYYGHNDSGGVWIYVKNGIVDFAGGTATATAVPASWVKILPYPGESVTLTGTTGGNDLNDMVAFDGIGFDIASGTMMNTMGRLWVHNAPVMTAASTQPWTTVTNVWITNSKIQSWNPGLRAATALSGSEWSLRGCDLNGYDENAAPYLAIANVHPNTNGYEYNFSCTRPGQASSTAGFTILYNNYLGGSESGNATIDYGSDFTNPNGSVVANNTLIFATNNSTFSVLTFCTTATLQYTNMIYWHNTHLGGRCTFGYNDSGTAAAWRVGWSVKANVWSALGLKTDTFGTPSGNRVGNWELMWNANWSHNMRGEIYPYGSNDFPPEFPGVYSYSQTNVGGLIPPAFYLYPDDQSNWGTNQPAPAGGGDYTPLPNHGVNQIVNPTILPFDALGRKVTTAGSMSPQWTVISPIGGTVISPIGTTRIQQ